MPIETHHNFTLLLTRISLQELLSKLAFGNSVLPFCHPSLSSTRASIVEISIAKFYCARSLACTDGYWEGIATLEPASALLRMNLRDRQLRSSLVRYRKLTKCILSNCCTIPGQRIVEIQRESKQQRYRRLRTMRPGNICLISFACKQGEVTKQ